MKHRAWLTAAGSTVAVMALLAAACGGGGGDDDDDTGTDCTPVAAGEAEIDQDNLEFQPNELCVSRGQEVLFRNSESAIHTVTIEGEDLSGTMREGDEFRWTAPSEEGTYDITCDFHAQMKARVSVVGDSASE